MKARFPGFAMLGFAIAAAFFVVATVTRGGFKEGVEAVRREDYALAYSEFLSAAESGDAASQYNLGWMCEQGQGTPKDAKTAFQWYGRAAEGGHPRAQFRFGLMIENGEVERPDLQKAIVWYRRAAEKGNNAANDALARIGETPPRPPNGTGFKVSRVDGVVFEKNRTDGAVVFEDVTDARISENRSTTQPELAPERTPWEKIAAFGFGAIFVGTILVIALRLANPTPFQYTIFRIILALSAAAVATFINGFLQVQLSGYVKAGGALAVFVIVYFWSPALMTSIHAERPERHPPGSGPAGSDPGT